MYIFHNKIKNYIQTLIINKFQIENNFNNSNCFYYSIHFIHFIHFILLLF